MYKNYAVTEANPDLFVLYPLVSVNMDNDFFNGFVENIDNFLIATRLKREKEYIVFHFNENQDDNFAYKFLRVRRGQRKLHTFIYMIDMEMGRTICEKHSEDIDNCPLQEGHGEKKVRCTYFLECIAWMTQFTVLNSTCVQT
ncbi:cystatin-12-like [Sigmodon hispidus]